VAPASEAVVIALTPSVWTALLAWPLLGAADIAADRLRWIMRSPA